MKLKIKEGDIITGQIDFIASGSAYLKVDDVENDTYIYKKNTLNALHMDTVSVEIIKNNSKLEGKVLSVIKRYKTEWVGAVQRTKGLVFVVPDSTKMPVDFYVTDDASMDAKDKQKVIVSLVKWKEGSKSPSGKITKILGDVGDNNTEMNSIMYEYGLPIDFPKEVELEAELIPFEITQEEIDKRKDLRSVTTIGIDPIDAKDADDTISLEFIDGERFIYVNIADVSHYVKEGAKIYDEALERSTSIYLVDRCIPMLPAKLSNGICSLKSGSDKLAFSAIFKMDSEGVIIDRSFVKTIIRVDKDYSYEEAQLVIKCGIREESKLSDEVVLELDRLAKKMRKRRTGSLNMDSPEVKFRLDENGKPIDVYFKIQEDSNKLIEEFMLLANKEVGNFLFNKKVESVYRIHDKPSQEKLGSLSSLIQNFGYKAVDLNGNIKNQLNYILADIKDKPEENMISTVITRCMSKAKYSTSTITGHYGLGDGFEHYTHFTSPIRRFSDLILHSILSNNLPNNGYL